MSGTRSIALMALVSALAVCPTSAIAQACVDGPFADGFEEVLAHLVISTQPSATPVGTVISPAVLVSVFDQDDTPAGGRSVSLALGCKEPGPASMAGTLTVQSNPIGVASFPDLSLDYAGTGYTLVATVSAAGSVYRVASAPFDATRVGDLCAGPSPACGSACPDADGDGLNDAWEASGGIDLNGDGVITAQYDTLLAGADPNVPDIFLQYDWMGYGLNELACSVDSDCTSLGPEHAGDTCTGPPLPNSTHSCVHACASDADCAVLGVSHVGDRCSANWCEHTHDPDLLAPNALADVAQSFASHGIHLHLLRGHELPHSHVLSFRQPQAGCEGAAIAPGTVGGYAVDLYDLKSSSFDPRQALSRHYSVFAHLSSCDTAGHCSGCPAVKGSSPAFGQSGIAELPGNDFIVSLGHLVNDEGIAPGLAILGGTFMHELGHNLGLHHAGGATAPGTQCSFPDCEDDPIWKPNYVSVMNYRYQFTGITPATGVGSNSPITCGSDDDCPAGSHCRGGANGTCTRLDYSNQTLPTGGNTPGALTENGQLNEAAGLGSGNSDLFSFDDGACGSQVSASNGAVDWDGDGIAGDNLMATADLNESDHPLPGCTVTDQVLLGHTDWGPAPGQSIFTYAFQCTGDGSADGAAKAVARRAPIADQRAAHDWIESELTPELAARAHALYPPRRVRMVLPGCAGSFQPPAAANLFRVALIGTPDFDVAGIDPISLRLQSTAPAHLEFADIDDDGIIDLVADFPSYALRLRPHAVRARLSGWMTNSQMIVAEETLCR